MKPIGRGQIKNLKTTTTLITTLFASMDPFSDEMHKNKAFQITKGTSYIEYLNINIYLLVVIYVIL